MLGQKFDFSKYALDWRTRTRADVMRKSAAVAYNYFAERGYSVYACDNEIQASYNASGVCIRAWTLQLSPKGRVKAVELIEF